MVYQIKVLHPKVYVANDQELSSLSGEAEESKAKILEAPETSSFVNLLKTEQNGVGGREQNETPTNKIRQ